MFRLLSQRDAYEFPSQALSEIMKWSIACFYHTQLPGSASAGMRMRQRAQLGFSLLAIIAAGMTLSAAWPAPLPPKDTDQDEGKRSETPLTAQEIHNLVQRVVENQRHNDLLLDEYARTEHSLFQGNAKEPEKDLICRVIPAGDGITRVELQRDGKTSDAAYLEQQWHGVAQALFAEAHGREPHVGNFYYRERHEHERSEMVIAIGRAFIFRWAGRQLVNGRSVVKLNFEPDPTYRSSARFATLYAHSRGTAWVDESSGELMRADAELTDDVSWGAGIIAKLYRGGRFTYEQHEIAPGVWLPTRYAYDFDGRRFLFNLNLHQRMDFTDYVRVGPPEEALSVIRREHPSIFANSNW
jgi:hypothetical protein